jgi:CheY-like chemotaxis protein
MSAPEAANRVILVVEDNVTNLMLIRAVLQRAGFQVEGAATAEEAEQWLSAHRPVVVLMDVQLPGQDGLSLTRQLRQQPHTADLPIIALTAHAMVEDRERALAAGCNGYIAKPINTRTLAQEVESILESAGAPSGRHLPYV